MGEKIFVEVPAVPCPECKKPFPKIGNRTTCSKECAKSRQNKQLKNLAARRRKNLPPRDCDVCGFNFFPVHGGQKRCEKMSCRAVGLQKAVEAQKKRREEAKVSALMLKEAEKANVTSD